VKVAAVSEPRGGRGGKKQEEPATAEPPPAKRAKSEKAQKAQKADADSVVVSKKEWEQMKQQLEALKNSLLPTIAAAPAEPSLPPRPELKRTRTGSRVSLLGAKLLDK